MKRGLNILSVLFLVIGFFQLAVVTADITGRATSQESNVSVQVIRAPPVLNIESLSNDNTYVINESLLLDYTVSGEQSIWYNIDFGENNTISGPVYLNLSGGDHTINLFANNTDSNVTDDQVNITINTTLISVIYDEYGGASTDFNQISFEDMQSISGVILENSAWGMVIFIESLNLTDDRNYTDRIVDIDTYTNISFNRIEVDSTELPNLNLSAIVYIYGLSFSDPRPLIDGNVCPSSICSENSYASGNFSFNVTHFTIFSSGETPSGGTGGDTGGSTGGSSGGSSGSSSSGGGTGVSSVPDGFDVAPDELLVQMIPRQKKTANINITNTGTTDLVILISDTGISSLLGPYPADITVPAGESAVIGFQFITNEDDVPDVYFGELHFQSGVEVEEIPVSVEVETPDVLFDVSVEIRENLKTIEIGKDIVADVSVTNAGIDTVNASITYGLKDSAGNEISSREDSIILDDEYSFTAQIRIPSDVTEGNHVFFVRVEYVDDTAVASDTFVIEPAGQGIISPILIFILAALAAMVIMVIILNYILKKRSKRIFRVQNKS